MREQHFFLFSISVLSIFQPCLAIVLLMASCICSYLSFFSYPPYTPRVLWCVCVRVWIACNILNCYRGVAIHIQLYMYIYVFIYLCLFFFLSFSCSSPTFFLFFFFYFMHLLFLFFCCLSDLSPPISATTMVKTAEWSLSSVAAALFVCKNWRSLFLSNMQSMKQTYIQLLLM